MTFLCRNKSGVWYYRKTFLLPSGKRKEIRKSLRTSDFKQAQFLALKLYFEPHQDHSKSDREAAVPITGLSLQTAIAEFLAERSRSGFWCAKEYRRGEVMLQELESVLSGVDVPSIGRREANTVELHLTLTQGLH